MKSHEIFEAAACGLLGSAMYIAGYQDGKRTSGIGLIPFPSPPDDQEDDQDDDQGEQSGTDDPDN